MRRKYPKIGANDACPCRDGIKYKRCCKGKVDWQSLFANGNTNPYEYMSIRGKNLFFLEKIAAILQLDQLTGAPLATIKNALRDKNKIRDIHEALLYIWPNEADLNRVLCNEKEKHSAIFTGAYQPEKLFKGMCRHSLYAEKILLVDPFLYPGSMRPEFDPCENPEQHANTTLNNLWVWFGLMPWIDSGIVGFIRSPGDFDLKLQWDSLIYTENMVTKHPEIKECMETDIESFGEFRKRFKDVFDLNQPSSKLRKTAKEVYPEFSTEKIDEIIAYFENQRENSPFIVDPISKTNPSQIEMIHSGSNYEIAREIASRSNSHLITDLKTRWKFIEIDRQEGGVNNSGWEPFAKSMQNAKLETLNTTDISLALRLRKENRLEGMRTFLRKVWNHSPTVEDFNTRKTEDFTTEFTHELEIARVEWEKIDKDLVKLLGGGMGVGAIASAMVEPANWGIHGLAYAGTLGASLVHSKMRRNTTLRRYPASLFIGG